MYYKEKCSEEYLTQFYIIILSIQILIKERISKTDHNSALPFMTYINLKLKLLHIKKINSFESTP